MNEWAALLNGVLAGNDVSDEQADWVVGEIADGAATPAQIAAIAVALGCKGESAEEVRAFAAALLKRTTEVRVGDDVLDIVGTGGDGAHSVNISTMAAITAAAAGCKVVKHGSRAASSRCGTADVLEHLGIVVDLDADGVRQVVGEVGIGFCLAARFHRSLAHTASARRELGIRTIFNFLGPLTNPARPSYVAAGVASPAMGPVLAEAFAARGTQALVFRGEDGLDEISVSGPTRVWRATPNGVGETLLHPRELGVPTASPEALRGGDVDFNARTVLRVLSGADTGPVRSAVLLNAAAGILACRPPQADLHEGFAEGTALAARAIDSGAALAVLTRWTDVSQRVAKTTHP